MTQPPNAKLAAAQAKAARARAQLGDTIGALKHRVSPQTLAHDAASTLKDQGIAAAQKLADGVKRRPSVAAAIVGGIALFASRRRIIGAFKRGATPAEPESLSPNAKSKKGPAG